LWCPPISPNAISPNPIARNIELGLGIGLWLELGIGLGIGLELGSWIGLGLGLGNGIRRNGAEPCLFVCLFN